MTESHLDLDALADALAGQADTTGHLASCPSCTSRLAELEAAEARVVAVLAALPDPPVPAGLAERLSAAFAAEAPLSPARTAVTALPERAPRRRFLPAAAAALLLVSGGGLGYALVSGAGGSDDSADSADTAATAAGAAELAGEVPSSSTGADYVDSAAVERLLPRLLAGGADSTTFSASQDARAAGSGTTGGGTAGSAPAAESQDSTTSLSAAAPAAADPLERLRTPEGLADCLTSLQDPGQPALTPLAVDYAQYQGQPALAVVLPDPDPAKVAVYVLGAGCSSAGDLTLAYYRVAKP
jgi:hypothetical protein